MSARKAHRYGQGMTRLAGELLAAQTRNRWADSVSETRSIEHDGHVPPVIPGQVPICV